VGWPLAAHPNNAIDRLWTSNGVRTIATNLSNLLWEREQARTARKLPSSATFMTEIKTEFLFTGHLTAFVPSPPT
jgi:hypothetical protein